MKLVRTLVVGLSGMVAFSSLVGCVADAEKLQITRLQDENMRLTKENNDLRNRIAQALAEAERNRRLVDQLQGELAAARAATPQTKIVEVLPPGWEGSGGIVWTDIADDILFDSGKADLKSSGRNKLSEVVRQIRENFADRNIWVVGHTDNDPIKRTKDKWEDNLDLSVHRGTVVTRELYKLGLDARSVVAGGQGEHNPKAPNNSRPNKQLNRRVQIIAIVKPAGGITPVDQSSNPGMSPQPSGTSAEEQG